MKLTIPKYTKTIKNGFFKTQFIQNKITIFSSSIKNNNKNFGIKRKLEKKISPNLIRSYSDKRINKEEENEKEEKIEEKVKEKKDNEAADTLRSDQILTDPDLIAKNKITIDQNAKIDTKVKPMKLSTKILLILGFFSL